MVSQLLARDDASFYYEICLKVFVMKGCSQLKQIFLELRRDD